MCSIVECLCLCCCGGCEEEGSDGVEECPFVVDLSGVLVLVVVLWEVGHVLLMCVSESVFE